MSLFFQLPLFIPGSSDLQLRRHLSFSEDSDLSSDDILERSSQKSKREVGRGENAFYRDV